MENQSNTTLEKIHRAAKAEFLEKGFKTASLRNIVKTAGMTTGAFYGYYKSKEELFEALVGEHYRYIIDRFRAAQQEFAQLPPQEQPENLSNISGMSMFDMLRYAYDHLEEFKLLLCCAEGTEYEHFVDEMVEIETTATHAFMDVLADMGHTVRPIEPQLEHILVSGLFSSFFEIVIHDMPKEQSLRYVRELREFYTAGWTKIMGL